VVLLQRDANGDRAFAGFVQDRGQGFVDQAVDW